MKNSIKTLASIAALSLTTAFAEPVQDVDYTNNMASNDNDIAMIQTSKNHQLSRLISMQTAQTLDSYSLAFSGSGNIHKIFSQFGKDGLEGSLILGLGNVVDIGYELAEFQTANAELKNNRSEGSIKLKVFEESKFTPAVSVGYTQTLNKEFSAFENTFQLEASKYLAMVSKNMTFGDFDFGVHGTIEALQYKVLSYNGQDVDNVTSFEAQPQLGITWQKKDGNLFILENKLVRMLDTELLSDNSLTFESGLETNFAVRFHVQTWLLFDAGIKNTLNMETDENLTSIHANVSGVIPLSSIGQRISSFF